MFTIARRLLIAGLAVFAGNAMSRRASYMYGNLLPPDPKGQVGAGLGTTTSAGTVTLIPPTDFVKATGEKHTIDGLTYEFLMAPGSEAPSEMLWFIEEKKAIAAVAEGRRYLYSPLVSRQAYVQSESQGLLDRLFDGRLAPLVTHFSEADKLSAEDIAELKALIERIGK